MESIIQVNKHTNTQTNEGKVGSNWFQLTAFTYDYYIQNGVRIREGTHVL